jgi:methionyl-tRNA formyltransferase
VVVLTCSADGWESAAALGAAPGVAVVAVVQTPLAKPSSLRARLRSVYRYHGVAGVLRIPLNRVRARLDAAASTSRATPDVPLLRFGNFHDADCLDALRALAPDLAVVDGTYVLRESVFLLPRFGSINLHCGKLPDYRGAPPAFWELYNGEREVGVTVHRVSAKLDEGPILQQEIFPLDPAPADDPVAYVGRVWREVLRPNGLRMLAECAARVAAGTSEPRPQPQVDTPAYRRPDFRTAQELRARVRARREGRPGR